MLAILGFEESAASVDSHLLDSCCRLRDIIAPVYIEAGRRDARKLCIHCRAAYRHIRDMIAIYGGWIDVLRPSSLYTDESRELPLLVSLTSTSRGLGAVKSFPKKFPLKNMLLALRM